MNDKKKLIIQALDELHSSLIAQSQAFNNDKYGKKVFSHIQDIIISNSFHDQFNDDHYDELYTRMKVYRKDNKRTINIFQKNNKDEYVADKILSSIRSINIIVYYICKKIYIKSGVNILKSPQPIAINYRPTLAVNKQYKYYHANLLYFYQLAVQLATTTLKRGIKDEDYFPILILRFIIIDGHPYHWTDNRFSKLIVSDIFKTHGVSYVRLNMKPTDKSEVYKIFPITEETYDILMLRANKLIKKDAYFFPKIYREQKNKKKLYRRIMIENLITKILNKTPYHKIKPDMLSMNDIFYLTAADLEVSGVPYIHLSDAHNLVRGPQINPSHIKAPNRHPAFKTETLVLHEFYDIMKTLDKKSSSYQIKISLAKIANGLIKKLGNTPLEINEKITLNTIAWLLKDKLHSQTTFATICGYSNTIANRILSKLNGQRLDKLSQSDWIALGESIASDVTYSTSSRCTTNTLFHHIYNYLKKQDDAPLINEDDLKFDVSRCYAHGDITFPDKFDFYNQSQRDDIKAASILAYYAGLRCEEIFHLTPDSFEDVFVKIRVSKIKSSHRNVPIKWLIPSKEYLFLLQYADYIRNKYGADKKICNPDNHLKDPDGLGARVRRALNENQFASGSIHKFRSGFASWSFVRYYMIIDSHFKKCVLSGGFLDELPVNHALFTDNELAKFAMAIGGIKWKQMVIQGIQCPGRSYDIIYISKFLGHIVRFTTLENYCKSMSWIAHYYLEKRLKRIKNGNPNWIENSIDLTNDNR